ncbi:MAG: zinc-ribbon domain-containing protein [Anaerolineae bacterium]|nr:zinc-ribbon domain-containing protein [Anaerolineae bacterium]
MRCSGCGKIIPDHVRYCPYCGTALQPRRTRALRWGWVGAVGVLIAIITMLLGVLGGSGRGIPVPVSPRATVISPQNAQYVTELARWSRESITGILWASDGRRVAVASLGGIYLYDAQTEQEVQAIGPGIVVLSVAFAPDGKTLASGLQDGTIRLWEVASGRELSTLCGHTEAVQSVAFAPDSRLLASGSWDGTVRLWEVASGRELSTLRGHTAAVQSVAFAPDGRLLASGSWDGTVRLWGVR